MSIPALCLLIVALLPYVWTVCAKAQRGYDNNAPRDYLANLEGWRRRAYGAHQNAWEALALFTAALVVAWHGDANPQRIETLSIAFVAIRVLHGVLYVLGWASLRSLVWFAGMITVVWLMAAGL